MASFKRRRIIVPIDYSQSSIRAANAARSLATAASEITLVHTVENMDLLVPEEKWGGQVLTRKEKLEAGMKRLDAWACEYEVGEVQKQILIGDPGSQIVDFATDMNSELIVVPSHGRKGLQRVLLGSVAERIIRHANCSVLVLRRKSEAGETKEGVMTPSEWLPRRRVIVPIDFSPSSQLALHTATEFVAQTDIRCIHILPIVDHIYSGMFGQGMRVDEARRVDQEKFMKGYLAEHGFEQMRYAALSGDPGTTIVDYAKRHLADLIVIPSHGYQGAKRILLGSVAERVIRHAECPVLVLRRGDAE